MTQEPETGDPTAPGQDEVKGELHTDLYNTQDIANIFRVTTKTVMRWANAGRFENHGVEVLWTIGGHRRFRKREVNAMFWKMVENGGLD
jgi:hypothetical protein